jgi:hypothetical protein
LAFPRHRNEDPSDTFDHGLRLLEYNTLNNEIERRERSLIMMGSIFLPVSFLLLGEATKAANSEARFLLVCTSLALYSIWLFAVQLTSWWLDEIIYPRLRWLESHLGFEAHEFVRQRIQGSLRIHIRRHHWVIFLVVLFIAAIFVVNLP